MESNTTSGYNFEKIFYDFVAKNPDVVNPYLNAIYFALVHLNNKLNWVKTFGITSKEVMLLTGIKTYKVYKRNFDILVKFGLIKLEKKSTNQFNCNKISLLNNIESESGIDCPKKEKEKLCGQKEKEICAAPDVFFNTEQINECIDCDFCLYCPLKSEDCELLLQNIENSIENFITENKPTNTENNEPELNYQTEKKELRESVLQFLHKKQRTWADKPIMQILKTEVPNELLRSCTLAQYLTNFLNKNCQKVNIKVDINEIKGDLIYKCQEIYGHLTAQQLNNVIAMLMHDDFHIGNGTNINYFFKNANKIIGDSYIFAAKKNKETFETAPEIKTPAKCNSPEILLRGK